MKKITFIGLLFLFIETKDLCETRAKLAQYSMKWQVSLLFLFIETKELCETRAKLAKQSMKWQVSYNVQIDPPSLTLPQQVQCTFLRFLALPGNSAD